MQPETIIIVSMHRYSTTDQRPYTILYTYTSNGING